MSLDLVWKSSATRQLASIIDYIGAKNYDAAVRLNESIHERVEMLRTFPDLGRPGRIKGTRELVPHANYVVIYAATESRIDILRILHARRQYP